ncbi:MAG: hypothetical protein KTV68_03375 [Acidimicrobiia bacterium]|nr:hypothetical protein [Acidimicrobiia bacterium]MCY4435499.1 hypothetical protein [bacterium]
MPASGPISEGRRLALMNRLCEVLGEEEGRTLMESLPDVHWRDLATKDDLKDTNKAIEASEHRLRTEMNAEFTKVYAEFTKVYAEFAKIYAEFKAIRAETAAEFQSVRSEMALQFAKQTRTMVFTMLGLAVPVLGAILAVGLA